LLLQYEANTYGAFAFYAWYPGTIGFIIFLCRRMTDKFNFFLLPLSFVAVFFIHLFVGIFAVSGGFFSNPRPEWEWYYVSFFLFYTVPFLALSLIIAAFVELFKRMERDANADAD